MWRGGAHGQGHGRAVRHPDGARRRVRNLQQGWRAAPGCAGPLNPARSPAAPCRPAHCRTIPGRGSPRLWRDASACIATGGLGPTAGLLLALRLSYKWMENASEWGESPHAKAQRRGAIAAPGFLGATGPHDARGLGWPLQPTWPPPGGAQLRMQHRGERPGALGARRAGWYPCLAVPPSAPLETVRGTFGGTSRPALLGVAA